MFVISTKLLEKSEKERKKERKKEQGEGSLLNALPTFNMSVTIYMKTKSMFSDVCTATSMFWLNLA